MKNIKLFMGISIGIGIGIILMLVGRVVFTEETRGSKLDNTYRIKDDIELNKKLKDSQATDLKEISKDEEDTISMNNECVVREKVEISDEFIICDSDIRELVVLELMGLDNELLAYARNEIFARKGYIFKQKKFKKYFEEKSWYVPNENFTGAFSELNYIESINIELIMKVEKENNWDRDGKYQHVIIRGEYEENGEQYLDIDFVEFFILDEAMKAAEEDGAMDPQNEYYIRNTVPKFYKIKVANDAAIRKIGMRGNYVNGEFGDFDARIYVIDLKEGIIVTVNEIYTP